MFIRRRGRCRGQRRCGSATGRRAPPARRGVFGRGVPESRVMFAASLVRAALDAVASLPGAGFVARGAKGPQVRPTLLTIGYETHQEPASLVSALQAARIERLVDVRELPLSRRRGFSKSA